MEKFCWWGGGVSLSMVISVVIAKAQINPKIWYGWILRDPHVVPVFTLAALVFWMVALGQHDRIKLAYWRVFAWLFRPIDRSPATVGLGSNDSGGNSPLTTFLREQLEATTRNWVEERGGSSARDQVIEQLKTEKAVLLADLKSISDGEAAARANFENLQEQAALSGRVWMLKLRARSIRRVWPDADFNQRPAFRASWIPAADAKKPCQWLGYADAWHSSFMELVRPEGWSEEYLNSLDFNESMEVLDDIAITKQGQLIFRRHLAAGSPDVSITRWGSQGELDGFFLKNISGIATKVLIRARITLEDGEHDVSSTELAQPLVRGQNDAFVFTPIERISDRLGKSGSGLATLLSRTPTLSNGTRLAVPVNIYYQDSYGHQFIGRHEMRAVRGTLGNEVLVTYLGRETDTLVGRTI